jgi:hypothetical protein
VTIPLPLLFVAAALAYLSWRGSAAPAGAPSLPPIGPPGLAPPGAPATPAAGGVTLFRVAPWLLVAWLAFSSFRNPERPDVPPAPAPAVGLDLRGKFVGSEAAADAAITAELLAKLADAIEYDGAHDRRLTTGAQLADLRAAAREYRTAGVSLGQRQPLARDAIKAFLDQEVGTDGGPIDDAARARWVTAFRAISAAARTAIGR